MKCFTINVFIVFLIQKKNISILNLHLISIKILYILLNYYLIYNSTLCSSFLFLNLILPLEIHLTGHTVAHK